MSASEKTVTFEDVTSEAPDLADKTPFEYQWPQDNGGEFYLIESQVREYLKEKDLLEKFPEIQRHDVSMEERKFLLEQGAITEAELLDEKLNIASLNSDDVRQVMIEQFPQVYREYLLALHKKERQQAMKRAQKNIKMVSARQTNALKKAMKDASEYNSILLQQRKEERASYYDMQTQLIHIPSRKNNKLKRHQTEPSKYPVALLPGQYQDYYHAYSSTELNQFPLGTLLAFPAPPKLEKVTVPDAFQTLEKPSEPIGPIVTMGKREEAFDEPPPKRTYSKLASGKKDPICGICLHGPENNKKGQPESLIHCSECENSGHPTCLDMSLQLVKIIKTYSWQCMECKRCTLCNDPHDEDKMLFCDECDRGYHSFCVGLEQIPVGRWICDKCGMCASCMKRVPGPEGSVAKWKHEFTIAINGEEPQFLQTLCISCSRLFRNGNFCPICLKVYRNDETDLPMVCCDMCDRWTHTDCDGISEKLYKELSKSKSKYKCALCRGEKEERMKAFHRLYRNS